MIRLKQIKIKEKKRKKMIMMKKTKKKIGKKNSIKI